ncbi:MAG: LysR family transcriptional regulator [Clostridia bacterium]|nr:LysR family transcriptional regulator [Clostridia bacterium]
MNLQYLYHFMEIVDAGSFSAAARKLRIAQPALSNQVKALEERYETRLLQRGSGTRGLELTETGKILYDAAKTIREAEEKAAAEIGELNGTGGDTLRIGLTTPPGKRYLMESLQKYTEQYPESKVMVREANESELYRMLSMGIVEAIVAATPKEMPENVEVLARYSDKVVASYLPHAFFAGNDRKTVTLEELCKFPLCVAQDNLNRFREVFRKKGLAFMPKYIGTDTESCLIWARDGKAVALVPQVALVSVFHWETSLAVKSIAENALGGNDIAFLIWKKRYRSGQLNRFFDVAMELLHAYGLEGEQ